MLQQINSLLITGGNRIEASQKELSYEERQILIDYLSKHNTLKLDKELKALKSLLKLDPKVKYSCNFQEQGKLDGLKTVVSIKDALKKEFDLLSEEDIFNLWKILHFAKDDEWLKNYLKIKYNFSDEAINKLLKITLEKDYANLSHKAISKMIGDMRKGLKYHEAAKEAGYHHSLADEEIDILDYLPDPPKIANPLVTVALYQLKKVVNSIIDYYGKPDIIRVELARDLKLSRKQRLEKIWQRKDNEQNNKRIIEKLISDNLVREPSKNDILKYKLWEECNGICPYTGASISLSQLYLSNEVDIEHILPYSKTLDDSYMNKTLCFREENAKKGDRTPYEAYSSKPEIYNAIKERIKDFPFAKAKKFLIDKIDNIDDFIERQLNDTRYISREARKYLKHITQKVYVTTGQATGILRHYWGLNNVLLESNTELSKVDPETDSKIRDDHRHHSIDALVVALTTNSFVKQLSTLHRRFGKVEDIYSEKFPFPFPDLRQQVVEKTRNMIVSRKVNKKVRGALHEDTFYGKLFNPDGSEKTNESGIPLYAIRKPLNSLTSKQIISIIDPKIKEIVFQRLESFGVDTSNDKFQIPAKAFDEPLYLDSKKGDKKIKINKVRIFVASSAMIKLRGYNLWVEPGSNHHMEIFSDETGKKIGRVISVFDAMQRIRNKQPVINKYWEPNYEFLMSLQINELIIKDNLPVGFDFADKSTYHLVFDSVYRVQKMDKNNSIVFRKHYVSYIEDNRGVLRKSPSTFKGTKIIIDPAGFLELADD